MAECKCPYCMEEINVNSVHFLFNVEIEPSSKRMKNFLKPAAVPQQEDPFYLFWNKYNRNLTPNILNKRIVKSQRIVDQEIPHLGTLKDNAERKRYAFRQDEEGSFDSENRMALPGQSAESSLEDVDEDKDIFCEIVQEERTASQSQEPISYIVRENGRTIARTRPVCPHCYNVLPEEIFTLDLIKIALAAGKGEGKTCLALSWYRTLRSVSCGLNRHMEDMDFKSMMEENRGADNEFNETLKDFYEGICPKPTNEQFIPPTFFQLSYRGGKKKAIVGIYDAAGEVITNSYKGRNLVDFMSYMDGIIYMLEPDKIGLQSGTQNKYLYIKNDSENIFKKNARVLDDSEQIEKQSQYYEPRTLGDVMMQLCGNDMAAVRENCSNEVLAALRNYVSDEALKRMHVALAISKCDELKGNPEIEAYNAGNLLFAENIDENQEALRQMQLQQLFAEKIFKMDAFDHVFGSRSGHMIAALGCETEVPKSSKKRGGKDKMEKPRLKGKYAPIRIEEPIWRIVAEFAKKNGWND